MGDRQKAIEFVNTGIQAAQNSAGNQRVQYHAFEMLTSACYVDPTYSGAYYATGNVLSDSNFLPASIACWRRALECNPEPDERARILTNLGWRLHGLGQNDEALEVLTRAVEIPGDHLAYAWVSLSVVYGDYGRTIAQVGAARKAYEINPADPVVEMAYAFALLYDAQYAAGFKHFESRFPFKLKNFVHYPYPKWTGEPDKTVFLVADQGLGDTLSFSRFVPLAAKRARYIHACVQPELMRVFQHAFLNLPNVNLMPNPCQFPQADAWSTFVSLPFALGLTDDEIKQAPNIDMPHHPKPTSWKVPDRLLHIGISWEGSTQNDINVHRSIPVWRFLDLYQTEGIQLYSLQADDKSQHLHDFGCIPLIKDLKPYLRDVSDTIGLLDQLDMVITIESALGHIAGMMGKETWIPYSYLGHDYRIGHRGEKVLWNPKHKIFRQGSDCDWAPVFEKINHELRKKVRSLKVAQQDAAE